jgi:hypothetical protein
MIDIPDTPRVLVCHIHGTLGMDQCYVHRRASSSDLECKECVKTRQRTSYMSFKDKRNASRRDAYRGGSDKKICQRMRDTYASRPSVIGSRVREYRVRIKTEVLSHYSGGSPKCAVCKVPDIRFLALDHMDGSGRKHRQKMGMKHSFAWAKRNGFPALFQVLCHNCNVLSYIEGVVGKSPSSRYLARLKTEVLSHYSDGAPTCALCNVSDIRILTIGHEGGGGEVQRRKSKRNRYLDIKRSGFPTGLRVLCFNHNLGLVCLG